MKKLSYGLKKNEKKFIENPESYDYLRQNYKNFRREREFKIKKMKDYIPRKKPANLKEEIKDFHDHLYNMVNI